MIYHVNGVKGAGFFANTTADTASFAHRQYFFAALERRTAHPYLFGYRYQGNQVLGANGNAFASGTAETAVYFCNAVFNMDSAKRTGFYAAAHT